MIQTWLIRVGATLAVIAAAWLHGCHFGDGQARDGFEVEKARAVQAVMDENQRRAAEYERTNAELSDRIRTTELAAAKAAGDLQRRLADAKRKPMAVCAPVREPSTAPDRPGSAGGPDPVRLTWDAVRLHDDAIRATGAGPAAAPGARRSEAAPEAASHFGVGDLIDRNVGNADACGEAYRRVRDWEEWAKSHGLW